MDIKVSFNPSIDQLCEIEKWLQKEEDKYGQGFYCNWNIIERNFNKKQMAIILKDEKAIGFAIWEIDGFIANIHIAEIKRGLRKKGYGSILTKFLLEHFLNDGVYVVKVHCQPETSEKYWKTQGFLEYPDVRTMHSLRANKHLYKILVSTCAPTNFDSSSEQFCLWDREPHEASNLPPKWVWTLLYKPGSKMLNEPIIYPCYYDWQIKWIRREMDPFKDKVKYFPLEIEFDRFMIITELP